MSATIFTPEFIILLLVIFGGLSLIGAFIYLLLAGLKDR